MQALTKGDEQTWVRGIAETEEVRLMILENMAGNEQL
jgi:hypothetical protein